MNLVSPSDTHLYFVTDSCEEACREIERFYANYDSIRYVGNQAIIRLRHRPTAEQLAELNERHGHLVQHGRIETSAPLSVEVRQDDRVELPRIRFQFAHHRYGDLRALIDTVNSSRPRRPTPRRPPSNPQSDLNGRVVATRPSARSVRFRGEFALKPRDSIRRRRAAVPGRSSTNSVIVPLNLVRSS